LSKLCLIIAAGLATTAISAAAAQTQAGASAANAPGPTTRAQFLSNVQNRFNALDTNHDGVLEANEVSAEQEKELQQARTMEQQQLEGEFNRLDTNHDGQLSKSEFMAAAPAVEPRQTAQQLVASIDTNKDGKISLQEYEAGPLATFSRIDTNHDGTVTPQEIAAAAGAANKPVAAKSTRKR
jgi:Ca2+-binding EF-hand superfamily protein